MGRVCGDELDVLDPPTRDGRPTHSAPVTLIAALLCLCRFFVSYLRAKRIYDKYERDGATLCGVFRRQVHATPDKVCFLLQDERWTYRDVSTGKLGGRA